jgi:hypothetical protein
MPTKSSLAAFALLALSATPAAAKIQYNGMSMNGMSMNGMSMNGVALNGMSMNGMSMNGVSLDNVYVSAVNINGSYLSVSIADNNSTCSHSATVVGNALPASCSPCAALVAKSQPYCSWLTWDTTCVQQMQSSCTFGGSQLVGATFSAWTPQGRVDLTLQGVKMAPDPNPIWWHFGSAWIDLNNDIYLYSFTYTKWIAYPVGGRLFWIPYQEPICPTTDRDGNVNTAVAVKGTWPDCVATDSSTVCGGKASDAGFTLACTDVGAIAKCVERMGYRPWSSVYECDPSTGACHTQSLDPFHQSCVRMVRADYCGDGTPHTIDGHMIDVYDGVSIQSDDTSVQWANEAGWSPMGAECMDFYRVSPTTGQTGIQMVNGCWSLHHVPLTNCGIDGCVAASECLGAPGRVLPRQAPWSDWHEGAGQVHIMDKSQGLQ